jgi:hypothetical protein
VVFFWRPWLEHKNTNKKKNAKTQKHKKKKKEKNKRTKKRNGKKILFFEFAQKEEEKERMVFAGVK